VLKSRALRSDKMQKQKALITGLGSRKSVLNQPTDAHTDSTECEDTDLPPRRRTGTLPMDVLSKQIAELQKIQQSQEAEGRRASGGRRYSQRCSQRSSVPTHRSSVGLQLEEITAGFDLESTTVRTYVDIHFFYRENNGKLSIVVAKALTFFFVHCVHKNCKFRLLVLGCIKRKPSEKDYLSAYLRHYKII